jgi:para-nitrobenzyl esterase
MKPTRNRAVMRSLFVVLAIAFIAAARAAFFGEAPMAKTTAGQVRGFTDHGVTVFRGIPYGEDTARRRFQPPVPPQPWNGVRDCIELATSAPQPEGQENRDWGVRRQGEDCLMLNLWTPALRDGHKRPVLVHLHGGGYFGGTGNKIDGANLSRRGDVVVVAVSHRLNGFGYLYLGDVGGPEFADSGNVGQLDQVLALQWIHENIAEFGGDPGCVTIFGESGGAGKCATLMAMPAAQGLFHRVWSIGGAEVTARTREQATAETRLVLQALNLAPDRIAEIKTMPLARLVHAFAGRNFGPVVDGRALPRAPFHPDASPLSAEVPMVIGTAHNEWVVRSDPTGGKWESLLDALRAAGFIANPRPQAIVAEYRKNHPTYSPFEVYADALAAVAWSRSILVEAERRAAQGDRTWAYCLEWPGRGKAVHTLDLCLLIDDPQSSWRARRENAQETARLAEVMCDSFVAFARTGDPNVAGLPSWPRFDLVQRQTMLFELPPRVVADPRGDERRLFASSPSGQPAPVEDRSLEEAEGSTRYAPFKPFVGVWLAHVGQGSLEMRLAWADNAEGLQLSTGLINEGQRTPLTNGFYGWNGAKKTFEFLGTITDGRLRNGIITIKGSTMTDEFTTTAPDGVIQNGRNITTETSADTLLQEGFFRQKNGEWKKVSEQLFERSR